MSPKARRRRPRPTAPPRAEQPVARGGADEVAPAPRRAGLFGGALIGPAESSLPPMGLSLGHGLLAVASQPALVVATIALTVGSWLLYVALGFEGIPRRFADVLAMPPVSTWFDLGSGSSLYGLGGGFLVFLVVTMLVRAIVVAILTGLLLESLEDGHVSGAGIRRGLVAMPTTLVVHVASLSLIFVGNLILPILGTGIGFLGFVAALVAGLYFLGFAPAAAIREGRPVVETLRRSARAAMLPGGRHLVLCSLYFLLALPFALGLAPGGDDITANPSLVTWVFVIAANVLHVVFMGAFAYRWVVAEPSVPEQPVRRRAPARGPAARTRR